MNSRKHPGEQPDRAGETPPSDYIPGSRTPGQELADGTAAIEQHEQQESDAADGLQDTPPITPYEPS